MVEKATASSPLVTYPAAIAGASLASCPLAAIAAVDVAPLPGPVPIDGVLRTPAPAALTAAPAALGVTVITLARILVDRDHVWLGGGGEKDAQILKFTRTGRFVMQIGRKGRGRGSNDIENLGGAANFELDR